MSAPDQNQESGRGDAESQRESPPSPPGTREPADAQSRQSELRAENERLRAELEARDREREQLIRKYERLLSARTEPSSDNEQPTDHRWVRKVLGCLRQYLP